MRFPLAYATLFASTLLLTSAGPAHAQGTPVDRARALGQQAGTAFEQGHWEEARGLYHQARELYPAPTLGVREARCLFKLGRLVEAKVIYEQVAALATDAVHGDPATFKRAQSDATGEVAVLKQRMPYLTIRAEGGSRVALTLDGVAIVDTTLGTEREIDPGAHTVAGTIDDKAIDPIAVTLADGEHGSVTAKAPAATVPGTTPDVTTPEVPPVDAPPPPPKDEAPATSSPGSTQRILGFTAMGAGVVGIGVGIGLGLAAGSKHSDLLSNCTNTVCPPDQQSNLDSFHSLTTGSTIAYVVGGVFAAGGLVLVLTAPKSKPATTTTGTIEPLIGLGTLGMRGVF